MADWENNEEIQIFREYLRIPTVHPNVNYDSCIEFLKKQSTNLGLPYKIYTPGGADKPILIMTWEGTDPSLPSIVLNSHTDVVPVFPEMWTHPPFAAEMDSEGKIFARGAQDMKCVGMQYLGAIRSLKNSGIRLKRTIHISFVPDEETGGNLGMKLFIKSDDFKALNVGFALDEGIAGPTDVYPTYYAERSIWHFDLKCSGNPGHGSLLLKNTAGEKVHFLTNKLMELRAHEVKRLANNPELTIGDVTTVNLTKMNGGIQSNVVPPLLTVHFDVRIAIDVDHETLENQILGWCEEAGGDVEMVFTQKGPYIAPTKIDDSNDFWLAFKTGISDLGLKIKTQIFPGGTDSRYIRQVGIPAIGFSPMNNTPVLLHDHDEFLKADTYLNGIEIYKTLIPKVANV